MQQFMLMLLCKFRTDSDFPCFPTNVLFPFRDPINGSTNCFHFSLVFQSLKVPPFIFTLFYDLDTLKILAKYFIEYR